MVTTTDWNTRYAHLMAVARRPPEVAEFEPVPAEHLRFGDRILWGGNRAFTVMDLRHLDDTFLRASCEHGNDHVTIDLHRREQALVLTPRPTRQPQGILMTDHSPPEELSAEQVQGIHEPAHDASEVPLDGAYDEEASDADYLLPSEPIPPILPGEHILPGQHRLDAAKEVSS